MELILKFELDVITYELYRNEDEFKYSKLVDGVHDFNISK